MHTQRPVQLPEGNPGALIDFEDPDAESQSSRDKMVRLRHTKFAAPSPPQTLDTLYQITKAKTISYLKPLVTSGSESIDATWREGGILFAGFMARM